MPQMAPISWLILFLVFSCTLLTFNFLNYFSLLTLSPAAADSSQIQQTPLNWKW
uniref:ATP synthase complex subunit 8 n=1 Tax=Dinocras cephalotes TaxID=441509 RepID=U5TTT4_DINCE|nr:ATP synthase F0 subunit 8 [Dinocras cephalotes]AGZ03527.1 ATP synthase FO subunit 8 [Dinocras cephalotes]